MGDQNNLENLWEKSENLRAFLLDKLPPDETETLEQKLITENDFFDEVKDSEEELIDDFVQDALTPEDRERFLEYAVTRPDMASRVAVRRAFFAALQIDGVSVPAKQPRDRRLPLLGAFAILGLSLACALLAAISLHFWRSNHTLDSRVSQLETAQLLVGQRPVQANPMLEANAVAPEASPGRTLFFSMHQSRGAGSAGPLHLKNTSTGPVELELATPPGSSAIWHVSVTNGGSSILTQSGLKKKQIGSVSFVRLYLDPSALPSGTYTISLSPEVPDGSTQTNQWQMLVTP